MAKHEFPNSFRIALLISIAQARTMSFWISGYVSLWFSWVFFSTMLLISSELFERTRKNSRKLSWFRAFHDSLCPRKANFCLRRYWIASTDACKRFDIPFECDLSALMMMFGCFVSVLANSQPFLVLCCGHYLDLQHEIQICRSSSNSSVHHSQNCWGLKR